MKTVFTFLAVFALVFNSCAQTTNKNQRTSSSTKKPIPKSLLTSAESKLRYTGKGYNGTWTFNDRPFSTNRKCIIFFTPRQDEFDLIEKSSNKKELAAFYNCFMKHAQIAKDTLIENRPEINIQFTDCRFITIKYGKLGAEFLYDKYKYPQTLVGYIICNGVDAPVIRKGIVHEAEIVGDVERIVP